MILSERDLENYICENQDEFIRQLKSIYGEENDIKFLGRQVDLGNRENIADLIYYYDEEKDFRNYIVVELKYRNIQPKDLSQISRYMNVLIDKLSQEEYSNFDFDVHGVFVSFGLDDDMQYISMLEIPNIDYINIENVLKFDKSGRYYFNEDYLKNLKLDERIEKLHSKNKDGDK